jgi:hypothetical protein
MGGGVEAGGEKRGEAKAKGGGRDQAPPGAGAGAGGWGLGLKLAAGGAGAWARGVGRPSRWYWCTVQHCAVCSTVHWYCVLVLESGEAGVPAGNPDERSDDRRTANGVGMMGLA